MSGTNHQEMSFSDRLSVGGIVIGLAGMVGSPFLPPWLLDMVPDPVRIGIVVLLGLVIFVTLFYLLYHRGQLTRSARLILYVAGLVGILGVDLLLFNSAPTWLRGLIGAVSGAAFLIFAPQIFPKVKDKGPDQQQKLHNSEAVPTMFDLSDQAEASVGSLDARGDAVSIAKMAGTSKLAIGQATVIGPNTPPLELPHPPPSWMVLSDQQMKQKTATICAKLRALDAEAAARDKKLEDEAHLDSIDRSLRSAASTKLFEAKMARQQQSDSQFQVDFLPEIRLIIAIFIQRHGDITLPKATINLGSDAYYKVRSIQTGEIAIISGRTGGDFYDVVNYLELLLSKF